MCEHHDDTIDVLSFRLSDEDYADFVSFMQDKELRYESQSRRALNALEKALAEEQYDEHLSDAISQIREQLKDDKLSNLQTYRKDIEDIIVMEIVSRYAYEEAGVAVSVQKDEDVARAVDLLLDEAEYRRLLTKQ
jgi:carboxyl-terminal processing protease